MLSRKKKSLFVLVPIISIVFGGIFILWDYQPNNDVPTNDPTQNIDFSKNIIVLISDGCGYNHRDAASIYQYGEIGKQVYESFPVQTGMSTYLVSGSYDPNLAWQDFDYVKSGYTDSAAAATAMSTGIKTLSGRIGIDQALNPLNLIIEKAEELGKATGVVTSVEFSHATPAGFVAHDVSRENYEDIANEMIYNSAVDVIMGCGNPLYDNSGKSKFFPNYKYVGGEITWNDLTDFDCALGADANGDGIKDPWTLIQTREEFQGYMHGETPERVIGIPLIYETLQELRSGDDMEDPYVVPFIDTVPTLAEMTKTALNVLDEDEDGFFLMVEGGAVDWASHYNRPGRLIEEEIEFNKAVETVVEWVENNSNWQETLMIVTADHESGYLTGLDSGESDGEPIWNPLTNNGAGILPGMEFHSISHTNSLVPFYAKGNGASFFQNASLNNIDPIRGYYIDNTDIGSILLNNI